MNTYSLNNNIKSKIEKSNKMDVTFLDYYHLTMLYTYWRMGKCKDNAVFEVSFRNFPFDGEFAIFAGVQDVISFVETICFNDDHINSIKLKTQINDERFFDYLRTLNGSMVKISAFKEGTMVFPNTPLLKVEGELGLCQILETAILNMLNFPTLIASNAARFRAIAGFDVELFEFGARRAQGWDSALKASQYGYLGGFDGTSNFKAGLIYDIPIQGTLGHSLIMSYHGLDDITDPSLTFENVYCPNFVQLVLDSMDCISQYSKDWNINNQNIKKGELAAFIANAIVFPNQFLALIDTYHILSSGLPNFLAVALALHKLGFKPIGVRIDSGDLAYFSKKIREVFKDISNVINTPFENLKIVASNDISQKSLAIISEQEHEINAFGIGTNLVSCTTQASLGMIYKLVEINGKSCIKISEDTHKITLPYSKSVYRLYTKSSFHIIDLIQRTSEIPPVVGKKYLCRHLLDSSKKCFIIPFRVDNLLCDFWDKGVCTFRESLSDSRNRCIYEIKSLHKNKYDIFNRPPNKISVSESYYNLFHNLLNITLPTFIFE